MIITYDIGISTGWYSIGKSQDILGMAMKVAYGATAGVPMMQIDLETTSEFLEPMNVYRVKRIMKELGLKVGLHAELGDIVALESAERRFWENSHLRMIETIKNATELGFIYVNIHASQTIQLYQEEQRLKPFGHQYQVVGPDGKQLWNLCESSPATKAKAVEYIDFRASIKHDVLTEVQDNIKKESKEKLDKELNEFASNTRKELEKEADEQGYKGDQKKAFVDQNLNRAIQGYYPELKRKWDEWGDEKLRSPDVKFDMWKRSKMESYFIEAGEIGAYMIVAEYMYKTRDMLWTNIVGDMDPEDAYNRNQKGFNAAVAAYYMYNHLTIKDHRFNREHLNGMSIIEWLNAKKIYLLVETPEVKGSGMESLSRFYHPIDIYYLIKKMGSPYFKLCIDFEHMLSQKIEIDKVMDKLPEDIGKQIVLFHLTKPIPYGGTAHPQIPLGSRTQETIYRWLYKFREKGFKDGYLIYERGGGDTPLKVLEQTVLVLRLLKEYLEKGTKPDELPEHFYGISEMNEAKYKMQQVIIKEHAWDPLKGLITIPEEEHTFLGRAAIEKGKAEEWKRAKFR